MTDPLLLLTGATGYVEGRLLKALEQTGARCDVWRVETFEPGRRPRSFAEMKVPGQVWLEFEMEGEASSSRMHQTAIFDPAGLLRQLCWYALYLLHGLILGGMLRNIAHTAHQEARRQK